MHAHAHKVLWSQSQQQKNKLRLKKMLVLKSARKYAKHQPDGVAREGDV